MTVRTGTVRMSDIAAHPTHRMDAEYWLNRKESEMTKPRPFKEIDEERLEQAIGTLKTFGYPALAANVQQALDEQRDERTDREDRGYADALTRNWEQFNILGTEKIAALKITPMLTGVRYRVEYKLPTQRRIRSSVMQFLDFDMTDKVPHAMFNGRPQFGTMRLSMDDIISWEPTNDPIKADF
jgi:hypothetical protein